MANEIPRGACLMLDAIRLIFDWGELRIVGLDAVIYAAIAIAGTALFLIRLVLGLVLDMGDVSDAADLDVDGIDSTASFSIFSFLSVTAFLMGTGWMGLATRLHLEWGPIPAAIVSIGFGVGMMVFSAAMLMGVRRLAQEQTYEPRTAIGRTGQVYLTVPGNGSGNGRVRVSVSGRSKILDARTAGPALEAFTDVRIVEVRDDGVLIVESAGMANGRVEPSND